MTGLHHLPDEIVCHIFTLGCEFGDSDPFICSEPRRLKRFALLASSVCKWWRSLITESKHNRHLWICRIVIDIEYDRERSLLTDMANARYYLIASSGCDVDVELRCPMDTSNPYIDQFFVEMRLLLHFLQFLSEFTRQWRWIRVNTYQPEILYHLYSILNRVEAAPNLILLEISSEPVSITNNLLSPSVTPHVPRSVTFDLYEWDATGSSLVMSPRLRNYGEFWLTNIDLQHVKRLPSKLTNVGIRFTDLYAYSDTSIWSAIAGFAPELHFLDVSLPPPISRSLSLEEVEFPSHALSTLKSLNLRALPSQISVALESFKFQSLTSLSISKPWSSTDIDYKFDQKALLPALTHLMFATDAESVLRLLRMMTTPDLKLIKIDAESIRSTQALDLRQRHFGEVFIAPERVICTPSFASINSVSMFDFAVTETLEILPNPYWYEFYDEDKEEMSPDQTKLDFPSLTTLTLHGKTASQFIQNSTFDNLCSLRLEGIAWMQPHIWELWSECQTVLSNVIKLQLDLIDVGFQGSGWEDLKDIPVVTLIFLPVQHLTLHGYLNACQTETVLCITNQHGQVLWDKLGVVDVLIRDGHCTDPWWNVGVTQTEARDDLEHSLSRAVDWFAQHGVVFEWQRTLNTNEEICLSYKLRRLSYDESPFIHWLASLRLITDGQMEDLY